MSREFVWAIKNGDLEQVKLIVEKQVISIKQIIPYHIDVNQEVDGRPSILYAADYGQRAVMEYLLTVGADVN
ncbi:hypothetical protein HUJ05_006755, partial [Dendroctonus ponderosae]